jgi:hypothetical protein
VAVVSAERTSNEQVRLRAFLNEAQYEHRKKIALYTVGGHVFYGYSEGARDETSCVMLTDDSGVCVVIVPLSKITAWTFLKSNDQPKPSRIAAMLDEEGREWQ